LTLYTYTLGSSEILIFLKHKHFITIPINNGIHIIMLINLGSTI